MSCLGLKPISSKRMTADLGPCAEAGSAALDHAPSIDPIHRLLGQDVSAAGGGAEEGGLAGIANPGRLYIGVEIGF
jgi:hypothetical protein